MIYRLCLWCKWFDLQIETPGYSEYTPGDDAEIGCCKHHFPDRALCCITADEYRRILLTAQSCQDFVDLEAIEDDA